MKGAFGNGYAMGADATREACMRIGRRGRRATICYGPWLVLVGMFLAGPGNGAWAGVSLRARHPETGRTCLDRTIMVGSDLTFVVGSDADTIWSGGVFLQGDNRGRGSLWGRDADPLVRDWTSSHLAAAGTYALVLDWRDTWLAGYDLYTTDCNSLKPGDWFVLDYRAEDLGPCTVGFYDHAMSWNQADPNRSITFLHVPSRDFAQDGRVNLVDFAALSADWRWHNGGDPNATRVTDIDADGDVDVQDLVLFSDFWLWGTSGWKSPLEPVPDPNIIYSVVDADGRDEITLGVGQTVTLYVDMKTLEADVQVFSVEVSISDPNMGWIDNRPWDPNNPDSSTARILAEPRTSFFDYICPGTEQPEGILFVAASFGGSMSDGHMASFQYTPSGAGCVQLRLRNDVSGQRATLKPLMIHQVDPNSLQTKAAPAEEALRLGPFGEILQTADKPGWWSFGHVMRIPSIGTEDLWDSAITGYAEPRTASADVRGCSGPTLLSGPAPLRGGIGNDDEGKTYLSSGCMLDRCWLMGRSRTDRG